MQRMDNKKKKMSLWKWIALILVAVLVFIGAGAGYYIWSQEREERAVQSAVDSFLTALREQDYEALSQTVSMVSLESQGYTREALADRYYTVYGGIGADQLEVSESNVVYNEETEQYEMTYTVNMATSLGEFPEQTYETTLNESEQEFSVNWNTSLIFPEMETDDTVRIVSTPGERGDILDRNGNLLATEGVAWQAGLYPAALGEGEVRAENLAQISENFNVTQEQLENLLSQGWVTPESFVPFTVVGEGETPEVTGVRYQETVMRTYPLGEAAAHLTGYVGEVTAENIEANPTLQTGDIIGKAGLEAAYDAELRGQKGGRIVLNNSEGELKKVLQETEVQNGSDITLTIDANLQQSTFDQLSGQNGSAVFIDPEEGDLLALVSAPSYDPNLMTRGISTEEYQAYSESEDSPFLARYASGYAPGSTFKTITGAIGLDSGVTSPEDTYEIDGLDWQKDDSWGDFDITRVTDVPVVDLETAYIYSDNIYFAREALEMGQETFEAGLANFIFGEDLDLPFSMNPAQISNEGSLDSEGLLASTAFGQGQLLLSPIQQAVSYTPFANDGQLVYPKIRLEEETESKEAVTAQTANQIEQYLVQVVDNPNGTANGLASIEGAIAAKTGTAETRTATEEGGSETNGFLLAFDTENSEYLMVAMLENAASGDVIETMRPVLEELENNQ